MCRRGVINVSRPRGYKTIHACMYNIDIILRTRYVSIGMVHTCVRRSVRAKVVSIHSAYQVRRNTAQQQQLCRLVFYDSKKQQKKSVLFGPCCLVDVEKNEIKKMTVSSVSWYYYCGGWTAVEYQVCVSPRSRIY